MRHLRLSCAPPLLSHTLTIPMQTHATRGSSAGEFSPSPLPQRTAGGSYVSVVIFLVVVVLMSMVLW
jgi:hypothetical protein